MLYAIRVDIHDAIFLDAAAGVEGFLDAPIPLQGKVRSLDDQHRRARIIREVISGIARNDGDIRLGLGNRARRNASSTDRTVTAWVLLGETCRRCIRRSAPRVLWSKATRLHHVIILCATPTVVFLKG
jgi:hypothetical protein